MYWLDAADDTPFFPPVEHALRNPNGLLAVGGNLRPARLLAAYRQGIFPWYNAGQPILWWSPDPRLVLFPKQLHISRSLRKALRKHLYDVTSDQAFRDVMAGCAAPRDGQDGSWITAEVAEAYGRLHELGFAHSIEVWRAGALVGGIYGLALGQVFFGESMFSRQTDASKVALVSLVNQLQRSGYRLIDCQIESAHLFSLGAVSMPRQTFTRLLKRWCGLPNQRAPWHWAPSPGPLHPHG